MPVKLVNAYCLCSSLKFRKEFYKINKSNRYSYFKIGVISHKRLGKGMGAIGLVICELIEHTIDKF